ncbi:MAG TPA: DUF2851 family protein [Bacteroidales bacterium]|nr:DUF2851 family protein [Bacteroidales bacterium]
MNEDLLHYLWKYQRFKTNIITTDGKAVSVENPGMKNTDAGPDFTNAKIRIDSTLWAGNVEIHLKSSDWFSHRHHLDKAYDNIILHVVHEDDKPIFDKTGNKVATIELKDSIDSSLVSNYKNFIESKNAIACSGLISQVNELIVLNWLEKAAIERLQAKTDIIFNKLKLNKHDWEQTFYEVIARNFGFNVNAEPFELLAKSLPQQYIAKSKDKLFQIEALLFGQAGMLTDDFTDEYPAKLKTEYHYLQKKYGLKPIGKHLWKFLRIRPNNFPTIRLAQFAGLIHKSSNLFSRVMESQSHIDLYRLFDLECSDYWQSHYVFDKASRPSSKKPSKNTIGLLIINTIVPFVFAYGKIKEDEHFKEKALEFLTCLPPEKNHISDKFTGYGIKPLNAMQSQALIQIYSYYCTQRKCLHCSIGDTVLNPGNSK